MTITTLSSREFKRAVSTAKKAAMNGPVLITDRGRPAHVLLAIEDYQRLTKQRRNIAESLAMPNGSNLDFASQRVTINPRPVDLS